VSSLIRVTVHSRIKNGAPSRYLFSLNGITDFPRLVQQNSIIKICSGISLENLSRIIVSFSLFNPFNLLLTRVKKCEGGDNGYRSKIMRIMIILVTNSNIEPSKMFNYNTAVCGSKSPVYIPSLPSFCHRCVVMALDTKSCSALWR